MLSGDSGGDSSSANSGAENGADNRLRGGVTFAILSCRFDSGVSIRDEIWLTLPRVSYVSVLCGVGSGVPIPLE